MFYHDCNNVFLSTELRGVVEAGDRCYAAIGKHNGFIPIQDYDALVCSNAPYEINDKAIPQLNTSVPSIFAPRPLSRTFYKGLRMTILRVIDIETTGLAPPAEIIEFGRVDLASNLEGWEIGQPISSLYTPLRGISPETMAVHHITPADVAGASVCTADQLRHAIWWGDRPDVLVAHNCSFERLFIDDGATDDLPWICTNKCALRLWPEAPGHSNQILRYWRQHAHDPQLAMPPHRAARTHS